MSWNVKNWSAASVASGIWASLKRYLLSSPLVQNILILANPWKMSSSSLLQQLVQHFRKFLLESPPPALLWRYCKRRGLTRASAAREHQRNCGIKQGERFLLLPLRERAWRGIGCAERRCFKEKKKGDGLCNVGTCLHVPSEFMLAEEDTLPLRLLLGSATLY